MNEIEKRTGRKVSGVALDLADLKSVKSLPSRLPKSVSKIDVLMENAGVMAIPERLATKDGFERQIGVNHLGHARSSRLADAPREEFRGRIVAVSSDANKIVDGKAIAQALDANLPSRLISCLDDRRGRHYGETRSKCMEGMAFSVLFRRGTARRRLFKRHRGGRAPRPSCRRTCRDTFQATLPLQGIDAAEAGGVSHHSNQL